MRRRPRPSSNAAASTSGSSVVACDGTSRSSSSGVGSRSPTPRSPGRSRSLHGTHGGASSASVPGSSTTSSTGSARSREARARVTTRSSSACTPTCSPTSPGPATSSAAARAMSTAAAAAASTAGRRVRVRVTSPFSPIISRNGTRRTTLASVDPKAAVRRVGSTARGGVGRVRAAARAEGAGDSGLSALLGVHAVSGAVDALVAVALAGTLFFGVPVGDARGRVALYLLVTMAPFAVVAPVIGPALDRVRGRRAALAVTFAGRGVLAWVIAGAVGAQGALTLYPAAFALLVLSRGYAVARAAVPRVLPPGGTLVRANARVSLAGVLAGTVVGAVGVGLVALTSPAWGLRAAAVGYAAGAVLAIRLPRRIDRERDEATNAPRSRWWLAIRGVQLGVVAQLMLRATVALRAFAGFLTLFFAFLVRTRPLGGLHEGVALGLLVAAACAGSVGGTALGGRARRAGPERLVVSTLVAATLAAAAATVAFGLVTAVVVVAVAGVTQALSKLALDAVLQRDVPEEGLGRAFARTETMVQLAWVLGGGLGLASPLDVTLGLGLATAALAGVLVGTLAGLRLARTPRDGASVGSAAGR